MGLFFSQLVDRENDILLLAVTGSEDAVGYVWAVVNCAPENPFKFERRVMYINQIAVTPTHRSLGAGRMLIKRIEEYARELKLHRIELDSWMFNQDAHAFFEKMGFAKYRADFWKVI
ncbi:MAG TPA: GNAT family N-acetyltransferase [Clostridia bacterium]|nr:GNAT family N-acetyltransferase [Clostridia bacterium]